MHFTSIFQFSTAGNSCQMALIEKFTVPGRNSGGVMNKGKKYKIHLAAAQCEINPDRSAPACTLPKSNDCVCAQQKPICFPLTLMVLAMALSSPVITTFYFIHASLLRARGFARNGSGQAHPTRRSIIHCSHFLRGIHFFQEVI